MRFLQIYHLKHMQVKFKQSCNLYIESITTCTKDSCTACYNDILHLKFTVLFQCIIPSIVQRSYD